MTSFVADEQQSLGLIHYWNLDEASGSTASDAVGGAHGTLSGATWEVGGGTSGSALRFDGSSDYLDIGTLDVESGSGLTLALWFKADDFDVDAARLIAKATGKEQENTYWLLGMHGKTGLRFRVRAGGSTEQLGTSTGVIQTGTWYHAAATYDGSTMKIYIDGAEMASKSKTGAVDTNPSVYAAVGRLHPTAGAFKYDGLIDDVRIYDRGLSASEIADLASGALAPARSTPVPHLYVGTLNYGGGEIWRTPVPDQADGPYSWQKVLDTGSNPQGNAGFRNMVVFNDRVWAVSRNDDSGCQLWRSDTSGMNFQMVVGPGVGPGAGFGDPDNESGRGLHVFGDFLYIGLQNTEGGTGELWRTNGDGTFQQVALPAAMGGAGSGNNSMHTMAVRDGKLYVGARNLGGGLQIWSSPDGVSFSPVVGPGGSAAPSGFGDLSEGLPLDLHVHNGYLFVGVGRAGGFNSYRIDPGDASYTKVASGGLGDGYANYSWRYETFDGHLWMGVYNYLPLYNPRSRRGAELYRSPDNGDTWELMVGGLPFNPGECFSYGLDDRQNYGIRTFHVVDGKMYLGTATCPNGCSSLEGAEVWVWPSTGVAANSATAALDPDDTNADAASSAPTATGISTIYPNPFNPSTTVEVSLTTRERVTLGIYDARGKLVRTLKNGTLPAGLHRVDWDGRDDVGNRVATGVYFVRFNAGSIEATRKAVLIK
jgi:hypothetical protein